MDVSLSLVTLSVLPVLIYGTFVHILPHWGKYRGSEKTRAFPLVETPIYSGIFAPISNNLITNYHAELEGTHLQVLPK